MRIALAQINPTVGDLMGNAAIIADNIARARAAGAQLVVFPELALTGYPPKDLVFLRGFRRDARRVLDERVAPLTRGIAAVVGTITEAPDIPPYVKNSAILLVDGRIAGQQDKSLLPTYDVFDEVRYFVPAAERQPLEILGSRVAVSVCEDIWNDREYWDKPRYALDPIQELMGENPEFLVNINASPWFYGKFPLRLSMVQHTARKYRRPVVYVNQVGGNDDLIFDGNSFVLGAGGEVVALLKRFQPDFAVVDTAALPAPLAVPEEEIAWVYEALVLGLRDYCAKSGFKQAVLGLSGGIDSSLVACIAADALGPGNVKGVSMPSRYSSGHSKDDAATLASYLGIEYAVHPIEAMFRTFTDAFGGVRMDLAEENLQARIRGMTLMFLSNREGRILLTTGNKSELAMGYATLYGDMAGGLAVIADVPKMMVYALARYRNSRGLVIPEGVLTKAPSAELRPDQKDSDSLPEYDVLDPILEAYVEENQTVEEIAALGYPVDLVKSVIVKVDRNEYKRRQAAPGLKVTSRNFGGGRRMPIVNRWSPLT